MWSAVAGPVQAVWPSVLPQPGRACEYGGVPKAISRNPEGMHNQHLYRPKQQASSEDWALGRQKTTSLMCDA